VGFVILVGICVQCFNFASVLEIWTIFAIGFQNNILFSILFAIQLNNIYDSLWCESCAHLTQSWSCQADTVQLLATRLFDALRIVIIGRLLCASCAMRYTSAPLKKRPWPVFRWSLPSSLRASKCFRWRSRVWSWRYQHEREACSVKNFVRHRVLVRIISLPIRIFDSIRRHFDVGVSK